MTYFITALTDDKVRLIVSETHTTDANLVPVIEKSLRDRGYRVVTWSAS